VPDPVPLPADAHRLSLPTPFRIGPVNAWVLRGEPLTLVDPGPLMPETRAALDAGLAELGLRAEDLEQIVITHQHHDHLGLAAEVRERSGAPVAAIAPLAAFLADFDAAMDRDDGYAVALMRRHGVSEQAVTTLNGLSLAFRRFATGVEVDRVLADGDALEAGGRTFEVTLRPGHSPTDTLLYDAEAGLLVGGDHLLREISSNPVAHPPAGDEADPAAVATSRARPRPLVDYVAGMRATAQLPGLRLVLPGHGAPFGDARALVDARIAMHERRAAKILREVDGRRTAADIGRRLWRDVPVTQAYLVLSEVLGHLDLLAERGAVAETAHDGLARYEALGPGS
jgi:glyoxylase-like metal-dependent hydrolase (beta-lactamase superfamily II)